MTHELFGRSVRVTLASDGTEAVAYDENFDIDFTVLKGRTSEPNEAEIVIYNLSQATRTKFEKEFTRIRIEAGYQGATGVIFAGDIVKALNRRGNDGVVTRIMAADSALAWQTGNVNRTFTAGSSAKQVVLGLAKQLPNVTLGRVIGLDAAQSFVRPYVANGMIKERLDELAMTFDSRWSIQNGVFEWVANAATGTKVQIVKLTPESGLIGTPIPTEKGVEAISLLNPSLRPNDVVEVRSGFVDTATPSNVKDDSKQGGGLYRINNVRHKGSTYGNDFYTAIDTQRLVDGNVQQPPNADAAKATNDKGR